MDTNLFGLIGYPLSHSFSKKYFTEKFLREQINAQYDLFPLADIGMLPALLQSHPSLKGLNVTIPYKQAVIPFLDSLDATAANAGAVNTIVVDTETGLRGYNTDVTGFKMSLLNSCQDFGNPKEMQGYVLGNGGAAKAVQYVLTEIGMPFQIVTRTPDKTDTRQIGWGDMREMMQKTSADKKLIVNTTPVGTSPDVLAFPEIPFELLSPQYLVFDLIYNPEETVLLQRAKQAGCIIRNGLEMLHLQAEAAWKIWNL